MVFIHVYKVFQEIIININSLFVIVFQKKKIFRNKIRLYKFDTKEKIIIVSKEISLEIWRVSQNIENLIQLLKS